MKIAKDKLIVAEIFTEYGITNNPSAYCTHEPEDMDRLRKCVEKDAERFLKFLYGSVMVPGIGVTELTDFFFGSMMMKGQRNVAKKGWVD